MRRKYKPLPSQDTLLNTYEYNCDTGLFTRRTTSKRWKAGTTAGTLSADGYINISISGDIHRAHRLAWVYMTGEAPAAGIDHINGVRNDNRWINLREADQSHNLCNRTVQRNSSTGVKGVHPNKAGGYWATVCLKGKSVRVGPFSNVEEAKEARDDIALLMHGDFFRR